MFAESVLLVCAPEDHEIADLIQDRLVSRDVIVRSPGDQTPSEFERTISDLYAVIVLVTEATAACPDAIYRWAYARAAGTQIVPLRVEEVPPDNPLSSLQAAQFSGDEASWSALEERLNRLRDAARPSALVRSASRLLLSTDPGDRQRALDDLVGAGEAGARAQLVLALRSEWPDVQEGAARALVKTGQTRAVTELVEVLDGGSETACRNVLGALREFPSPVVDQLLTRLRRGVEEWTDDIIETLATFRDVRMVPPLIEFFDAADRGRWAEGPWLPYERAVAALGRFIGDSDWGSPIRRCLFSALDRLLSLRADQPWDDWAHAVVNRILRVLADSSDAWIDLVDVLGRVDREIRDEVRVVGAVAKAIGDGARVDRLPELLEFLRVGQPRSCVVVLHAVRLILGKHDAERQQNEIVAVAGPFLSSNEPALRRAAAETLGWLGGACVPSIKEALASDRLDVQLVGLHAIQLLEPPDKLEFVPRVLELMDEDGVGVFGGALANTVDDGRGAQYWSVDDDEQEVCVGSEARDVLRLFDRSISVRWKEIKAWKATRRLV